MLDFRAGHPTCIFLAIDFEFTSRETWRSATFAGTLQSENGRGKFCPNMGYRASTIANSTLVLHETVSTGLAAKVPMRLRPPCGLFVMISRFADRFETANVRLIDETLAPG